MEIFNLIFISPSSIRLDNNATSGPFFDEKLIETCITNSMNSRSNRLILIAKCVLKKDKNREEKTESYSLKCACKLNLML